MDPKAAGDTMAAKDGANQGHVTADNNQGTLHLSTTDSVVIVAKDELEKENEEEIVEEIDAEPDNDGDAAADYGDDDDKYVYSDDFEESAGEETDIEDNTEDVPYEFNLPIMKQRDLNPELPATVTVLQTEWGSKVYLVGTAHFSVESQEDVTKTIEATQPDVVMVELCNSRLNILHYDEARLLEEALNINMEKILTAIKQSGVLQGVMHLLFLNMSAHITKELGMAPGGEFRRAFRDAKRIPNCRLQLGDRPIQITLRRALGALSVWQKMRLGWYLLTSKDPISKEDVEKLKQKDLLEEMLKEMTGEFPGLSKVFVQERDTFLTYSLKMAAQPIPHPEAPNGYIPSVVVGVVGLGHVPGIVASWGQPNQDIREIMQVPKPSVAGRVVKIAVRLGMLGLVSVMCYRTYKWLGPKFSR